MDEVVLNRDERIDVEKLADLFAIITATEALEAAYNRGAVNCDEYERECKIFISKFKDTEAALIDDGRIKDVATFIAEYEVSKCNYFTEILKRYNLFDNYFYIKLFVKILSD